MGLLARLMIHRRKRKSSNFQSPYQSLQKSVPRKNSRQKSAESAKKSRATYAKNKNSRKFCDKLRKCKPLKIVAFDAKFNVLSKISSFIALRAQLTKLWPDLYNRLILGLNGRSFLYIYSFRLAIKWYFFSDLKLLAVKPVISHCENIRF